MRYRTVEFSETQSCPAQRLDAEHYIPFHRTWECNYGSQLRTRGAILKAWLEGKVSDAEFVKAMKCKNETKNSYKPDKEMV
jgi:hypothetical protein